MKYIELKVSVPQESLEMVCEELAAVSDLDFQIFDQSELELFDEDKKDYRWDYVDSDVLSSMDNTGFTFYLEEGQELTDQEKKVLEGYQISRTVIDDSWMNNLQGYFVPTRYGKNVVIKPDWAEYQPLKDDIVVEIDPGQAFGTGTSPTTALALELVEKYMVPGANVLDVGCGTGILGLLAAKMGAARVIATDIDPLAEEGTKRNIELNGCGDVVSVELRDLVAGLDYKADIVVANIIVDVLKALLPQLPEVCKDNSILIASGIIKGRADEGIKDVEDAGYTVLEVVRDQEWVALAAKRK